MGYTHQMATNHQTWGDKGRQSLYNIPQNVISWVKLGSTEWIGFSLVVHFGGFMRILYIRTAANIWHICRWYRRFSVAIHYDFTSKLLMDMWWAKIVHTPTYIYIYTYIHACIHTYIHTYNPIQPHTTPYHPTYKPYTMWCPPSYKLLYKLIDYIYIYHNS